MRVMDDVGSPIETAPAWYVAARNTLHIFSWYAPAQLVFWHNLSFPNLCDTEPPALADVFASHIVAQNLNAMHSARKKFPKCEYDDRIWCALLHQVREVDMQIVSNSNKVYFKRQDDKWHGPGKVNGRDGKQILVKHGGAVKRVHSFRMQEYGSSGNLIILESSAVCRDEAVPSEHNSAYDYDEDEEGNPVMKTSLTFQGQNSDSITEEFSTGDTNQGAANANEMRNPFTEPSSTMKALRISERIEFIDKLEEKKQAKVESRA